ncbi:hypothetical protein Lmor_3004 [Legionella moravica]|uniref:Uncharacterized protein n=1 Tax=Legionella moravica TaxID=39962 RepID=A0A378JY43_9GAMM|nr:hypothetical protein [Legionella moravica]KTD30897.1 hypothetical protein Lmor_3004 [Legionella moravica]STX63474.1 Uncharacterised protein [Legionella moravica]
MPLKDGKKRLVILDNLDVFVEKLLTRIAEESEQGRAELIELCETAKRKYNQPIQSWFIGWVYQYTRARGPEVDLAIKSMEEFHDTFTRLQEIKLLVTKGKWNVGSFNYYLLDGLIGSVPGYMPLTDKNRDAVIERVSELIIDKIDSFIVQYRANRKLIEAKELELQKAQQSIKQTVDNVLIAKNLEDAIRSAKESPDKIQFSIFLQKGVWTLHWVDVQGKAYTMQPSEEWIVLLLNNQSEDLDKINPVHMKRLKKECVKARDMFLDRVQVLVNPLDPRSNAEMSNDTLVKNGNLTTFVLRGNPGHYSLYWINSLGDVKTIVLDQYPQMVSWLEEQDALTEEHIYQLRAYLMYVNTSKSIGMSEFKTQLMSCLGKRMQLTTDEPEPVPVKTPVVVNKLNMAQFADLEACLSKGKKAHGTQSPLPEEGHSSKLPLPGKLNMKMFSTVVATLGGEQNTELDEYAPAQSSTPL